MANPHRRSVQAAQRTTKELYKLFGRMGTADHPRGRVLSAYRNARRALGPVLKSSRRGRTRAAQEILRGLRAEIETAGRRLLTEAAGLGLAQAIADLNAYELPAAMTGIPPVAEQLEGWLAPLDGQLAAVGAMVASGADVALVLGDDTRAGLLQPAPVVRDGAKWLTMAAVAGWWGLIAPATEGQDGWGKQAIAAIDERTTDCCLRVHGQVRPLDEPFKLTGTPRYADELDWSPFHWYCRTSVALVRLELADEWLTGQLEDAAHLELRAREETGEREEIHPSHARSRR